MHLRFASYKIMVPHRRYLLTSWSMGGVFSRLRGGKRADKSTTADTLSCSDLNDIARFVNLAELKPIFVEEGLLEGEGLAVDLGPPFREYSRQADRLEYLKEIFVHQKNRDAFHRCIQKSVEKNQRHLGHDYIATLLDKTKPKFAEEASVALSELLRARIERKMYTFVMCINATVLYDHLVEKRLSTFEEFEKFKKSNLTDTEINEKIMGALITKGPTAHLLFVQCLSETSEVLECHGELCDLISDFDEEFNDVTSPEQPVSHIQVPEYLKEKEYHERRSRFESCYHNGNWTGLYKESRKCMETENPVTVAIGYLELALGWIFQLNEGEVRKNLRLAHRVIMKLQDPAILYARCEYLHSLLLRYLQQYAKASRKAEVAMMILMHFEIGEDRAFAQYCYATSFVETLAPNCTDKDFKKAEKMLITAIDYAQKAEDMEILVTYSLLQLTRLYLGTTDTFLTVTTNQNRINLSNQCLEEIEKKLRQNELNMRFESLYYIRKSDYERSSGNMRLAEEMALKAKKLATRAELPIETEAATIRIKYIQQCLQISTQCTRTVGKKYLKINDSGTSTKKKRVGVVSN